MRRASGIAAHLVPRSLSGGSRSTSGAAAAAPEKAFSAAVPSGYDLVPGAEDTDIAAHLRWLEQKDALGQDALLLGPPGALRRQIALHYCELKGREAEVLTITRDTTEADLKQRRELSSGPQGTCTVYSDGAPVRCATRGRVLILDGLEKAERNVLPTLNNLLENREMALDDGRFLMPARRFDALVATSSGKDGDAAAGSERSRLVRVHPDFRVIALALPCPPCVGNPLDPPLRSRFQARVVGPPLVASLAQLGRWGVSGSEVLLRRLAAMQRALNLQALGGEAATEALVAALPPGARPPVLSHDALLRVLRLVFGAGVLPISARPTVTDALARAYPLELLASATAGGGPSSSAAMQEAAVQWFRHFQLEGPEGSGDSQGASSAASLAHFRSAPEPGGQGMLLDFGRGAAPVAFPSPALPPPHDGGYVDLPQLQHLIASVAQDFAVGHDCVLIGRPGCGKSALARRLAARLGYGSPGGPGMEFFFLYDEMSSRDLLQRRSTDAEGRTRWVDSPLIRAAKTGAVCVLDGMNRLRFDVLCALAPLLQDRQAVLALANDPRGAEAELLLRADRFQALAAGLEEGGSYDRASNCRVAQIHPSFRVLALAEPPSARAPWLSDELSTCFSHHLYPELTPGDLSAILVSLFPTLPEMAARRLVAAMSSGGSSAGAAGAAADAAAVPVPLRVLIRVARRAAGTEAASIDPELLAGMLQQALFAFLPRGERAELLARLEQHFDAKQVHAAAALVTRGSVAGPGGGWQQPHAEEAAHEPPQRGAQAPDYVRVGKCMAPRGRPQRPELVPHVDFVGMGRHVHLLEELVRAMFHRNERHLLLLGPQGVGKNRVVDHLLETLALEREYMQLHRDTSVAQLTVTPTVSEGRLLYEDSPLVRAAQYGRVLVLDEADKAPLEVVVVLKSLVEDGQLALPDGRRLAYATEGGANATNFVAIDPAFRMVVLANRPGFPFLGNDLIREADVFSVFCLDNPDAASELMLVQSLGPNVPEALLRTLVGIFADLRLAVEEGRLQYPYSTRELLAVVKHLDKFPDETLESALASILAFDRFDPSVRETLRPIFEKRGVPMTKALGSPMEGQGSLELQQPWMRALAVLRSVKLAATERLGRPVPAGRWRNRPPVDLQVREFEAQAKPAIFDPPQTIQLASLAFDRIQEGFSESMVRARLPMALRAGPIVDAVAAPAGDAMDVSSANTTLHLLATRPLTIWSIEDPLAVGAQAGRCSMLPVGAGADWALQEASSSIAAIVNGRPVSLGSPQLIWVADARALLLHSPLDILAQQLLIERPHQENVRAEVLATAPLSASVPGQVRRKVEDSFIAIPCMGAELRQRIESENASGDVDFMPGSCVIFYQPSGRRMVQLDVVRRRAREVTLQEVPGEAGRQGGVLERLVGGAEGGGAACALTATATARGVEVLLSEASSREGAASRFLLVLFPDGPADGEPAKPPTVRWVDAGGAASDAQPCAILPAAVTGAMAATPFAAADDSVSFAALPPSGGLAHVLGSGRLEDGSRQVMALLEATHRGRGQPPVPAAPLPHAGELAKLSGRDLNRLLRSQAPQLPSARSDCHSSDVAAPPAQDLLVRLLDQPHAHGSWVEAVHVPSRTARRLPARPAEEADLDIGGGPRAGVARVLPWPVHAGPGAITSGGARPDFCLVFRDGSVRWLELHPERLGQSLQEYLEVRGLRGLMQQAQGQRRAGGEQGGGSQQVPRGEEDDDDDEEEENEDDEDDAEEEEIDGEDVRLAEEVGQEGDGSVEDQQGKVTAVLQRRGGGRARRGRGGRARLQGVPGDRSTAGQAGNAAGGGGGGGGAGRAPEEVRSELIRQARRQRRRALEAQQREERRREQARDASGKPKHGDEDDKEHIGGNRWAGGTGGADTAGLGGKGGPYRLEKKGQSVHQISDEAKEQISEEAREAARKMGEEARQKRMEEIEMGGGDYDLYMTILGEVQGEIEQLRRVLGAAAARQREREWHRGTEGELDENRLVDAIAGEAAVFKRRAERESRPGEVLMRPKRVLFLFDTSASMYRFNGMDGRLRRSCEAAVMLMEALRGFEQKFDYAICCHDGDRVLNELVTFGAPPADEKERLKVIAKMLACAQYCSSGDNTLPAIERACERVAGSGPADDYFVFAFSDANFARYGLTTEALARTMGRHGSVNAVCFFIATFEDEALAMARQMPDRVKVCLDLKALPAELRQQFVSSVAHGRSAL